MTRDMTSGNVMRHLISFSIPIILGNLFQLTYNAVDSIIVAHFAGTDAMAAVGTGNPVMNIAILSITGICIGSSVLMSQYFGAGDIKKVKRTMATTLIMGSILSLFLAFIGLVFAVPILQVLRVPDEVIDLSAKYLRIIFLGLPFTFFYNAYAAGMRSVGDSKTPIRFLAIASVLNALLDMVFIAEFHMDVLGAALATILAEGISSILCYLYVRKKLEVLSLTRKDMHVDHQLLGLTIKHGAVTALQQACQPIGKLMIQGTINTLGVGTMAVFNAVNRIDDFAFTPEQSISHGMMTFISQNRGAKQTERMKKGMRTGLVLEVCYWGLICLLILLLKTSLMHLFVKDTEEVLSEGTQYLSIMAFFYVLPAFTNGIQGIFRGLGRMKVTLISTLIQISLRVIFVVILVPICGLAAVAYASAIGWGIMIVFQIYMLIRS